MSRWILALADDLTGALEAGAKFASHGFKALVTTNRRISRLPACNVLVIDTETRHLSEDAAFQIIHRTSLEAARYRPSLIYKKTDSTLRGPIAAELRALQAVFPKRPLIYAPAYVAMGRTVRNGQLYVGGTLLHETEFAHDPLNPVRESNIRKLLINHSVLVLDSESQTETEEAARMILQTKPPPVAAGPAALAEALAANLAESSPAARKLPRLSRCLIVNGSLHPVSHRQVSLALNQSCFDEQCAFFNEDVQGTGVERALTVGSRIRGLLRSSTFDGLVLFGGDTAFGIHRALGAPDFESLGEVLPGVPISQCGGLFWITKAGGFGAPDLLLQLRSILLESK